jgi:hypothetical protein
MKVHALGLLVAVLVGSQARGFELDGLRSGQSRAETLDQLQRLGLQIEERADGSVMGTRSWDRFYSLSFCEGVLVQVQKTLRPTFSSFVELIDGFQRKYGQPVAVIPRLPDPTSVRHYSLSIAWRKQGELISADFTHFGPTDQLDIAFSVRQTCYRIPLLEP